MKFTATITLTKSDGPSQDRDAIRESLDEAITDIGTLYVQDAEHDDETEYEVAGVTVT